MNSPKKRRRRTRKEPQDLESALLLLDQLLAETDGTKRKRRRKADNKLEESALIDLGQFVEEINPSKRERQRKDSQPLATSNRGKPFSLPNPLTEKPAKIQKFAREIANQTAEQFLQDFVQGELRAVLSEKHLNSQQLELSAVIAEFLNSQFRWALNQSWLDARESSKK